MDESMTPYKILMVGVIAVPLMAQVVGTMAGITMGGGNGESYTYYVDSSAGSDSNAGTLALPWQTIAKVNGTTLTPGQSVGFKRGGLWRETLTPGQSGSAGSPITFGAYGAGANPVIDGTDVISGFTTHTSVASANLFAGDINSATFSLSASTVASGSDPKGGTSGSVITDDGTNAEHLAETYPAQTPGTTYTFSVFAKAGTLSWVRLHTSWSGGTQCNYWFNVGTGQIGSNYKTDGCTASSLLAGNGFYRISVTTVDPSGSTYVNTRISMESGDGIYNYVGTGKSLTLAWSQWEASTSAGNYTSGGTFTDYSLAMGTAPGQVFENGTRYLPVADQAHLNVGNSWWSGSSIYIRTSGNNAPTGYTLTASQRNFGVNISGKSYLTVTGIDVRAANIDIVVAEDSTGVTISNLTVRDAVWQGIRSRTSGTTYRNNLLVSGVTSLNNGNTGICFSGYTKNSTVVDSVANGNGQLWSTTVNDLQFSGGIRTIDFPPGSTHSNGLLITRNTTLSNGVDYNGLAVTWPQSNETLANGIGIWIDTADPNGAVVSYNVSGLNKLHGIYIENDSGILVHHNVAYSNDVAGIGVATSNNTDGTTTRNMQIYSNTLWGNVTNSALVYAWGQLLLSGYYPLMAAGCVNNTVQDNISVAAVAGPELLTEFGCENDTTHGTGNVYTYNAFGPQAANFIEWGLGAFQSTYTSWATAYGSVTNALTTDPLLTNPAAGDFTLQAGSPAIGAGVVISGITPASNVNIGAK